MNLTDVNHERAGNIFPSARLPRRWSLVGFKRLPVMNFVSGAIPIMNPIPGSFLKALRSMRVRQLAWKLRKRMGFLNL